MRVESNILFLSLSARTSNNLNFINSKLETEIPRKKHIRLVYQSVNQFKKIFSLSSQ